MTSDPLIINTSCVHNNPPKSYLGPEKNLWCSAIILYNNIEQEVPNATLYDPPT